MTSTRSKSDLFNAMGIGPVWELRKQESESKPDTMASGVGADAILPASLSLESLQEMVAVCKKCGLCETRKQTVFADGILGSVYFGPIFLVVALFLLVCICFTQEFIYHRYGIEMFPGYLGPRVAQQRRRQQEMLDHELLAQAQRHRRLPSNQLVREREEERKRTYQEFLKPYTMVVADNDLSLGEVGLNDDAWVQKKFEIMEQGESSWWSKECNRELGAQGETADFPQQTKSDRKNDEKEIWKEPKRIRNHF